MIRLYKRYAELVVQAPGSNQRVPARLLRGVVRRDPHLDTTGDQRGPV
jgi:hypothetical protein